MKRFGFGALHAALLISFVATPLGGQTSLAGEMSGDSVKAVALKWFELLQAGHIDRAQLTTAYSEHLTDESVKNLSLYLKPYGTPTGEEEILQTRTIQDQTFYVVKLLLPRGDALSMIIGFDEKGKITGIAFASPGQG